MKKTMIKRVLTAALSVAMLAATATASPLLGLPVETTDTAPGFTVTQRSESPIRVWGTVKEKGEDRIYLENSDETDGNSKIYVNVNEDTIIVDAVTGQGKAFADIKENERVYAYVGPAMTRSMPPIAAGRVIICNVPANGTAPTYAEIQSVTVGEDGKVSALTDRDVILHLNADTELTTYKTKNIVGLDDIKPGAKVLAWYSVVAMSMPAQATPTKVMMFPSEYEGYLTTTETGIVMNGDMAIAGVIKDGKLFLPVRTLAEAMSATVTWVPEGNKVAVTRDDATLYSFAIGGENVTWGESEMALHAPSYAESGVTYMALDDLLVLHDLKLAQ